MNCPQDIKHQMQEHVKNIQLVVKKNDDIPESIEASGTRTNNNCQDHMVTCTWSKLNTFVVFVYFANPFFEETGVKLPYQIKISLNYISLIDNVWSRIYQDCHNIWLSNTIWSNKHPKQD
jgi:hypothetical protein